MSGESSATPSRSAISRILRQTADLLELRGENPFRARAYANAGRAIEGLLDDPQELFEAGTLAEVKGIGPGLVAGIAEILQTGKLSLHEELEAAWAPGVLDLLRVPGLGPKRLRTILGELGVDSPAALERACREGRVAGLPGFGAKSQEKILEGLAALERFRSRVLLPEGVEVAERMRRWVASDPAAGRVEIAGSVRRRLETVGGVDLIAIPNDDGAASRAALLDRLVAEPTVVETISRADREVSVRVGGLVVHLRIAERESAGAVWVARTGPRAHVEALERRAAERGTSLVAPQSEPEGELESEERLYHSLGLAWIPPEARDLPDAIAIADRSRSDGGLDAVAGLVSLADLRGTFHVHTTWSDGIATVAEMAEAARKLGWEYLGIADHSRSAAYAGGLDAARVREQWREIDDWNASGRTPRLFKGTECDILADGALDFDDELLAGFDYVVASVHSRFQLSREAMTARLVKAVSHPRVTFLGHATGRLLLMREPYALDLAAVLDAAAVHGVIVELNANAHRLDLDWRELPGWFARSMPTSIHPDAHAPQGLSDVAWGIAMARKALARPDQVFNSRGLGGVEEWLAARRARAERIAAGLSS